MVASLDMRRGFHLQLSRVDAISHARLARSLAFPADGEDVGAAAEQAAEERDLLSGGELRRFRLARDKDCRLQGPPLDPMRFE